MYGKHKPLLPPEYKFSSAPKNVEEQLIAYLVLNFTGRDEENRTSPDYAFLQGWKNGLKELGRVETRQKEVYAFCGALSRRLGENIDIDRDLQWKDLAQKLRQQRWWDHYEALQAAHAEVDFSAMKKLLQDCRDGVYCVSEKVSQGNNDHSMLDEQTARHVSEDEENASDDDGATTAEIYITEEESNSTAIGDSDSQRFSGSTLDYLKWWDTIGAQKIKGLDERKKEYDYDENGKYRGLVKRPASQWETDGSQQGSRTGVSSKQEDA